MADIPPNHPSDSSGPASADVALATLSQPLAAMVAMWVCDGHGRILAAHGGSIPSGASKLADALAGIVRIDDAAAALTAAFFLGEARQLSLAVTDYSGRVLDLSCTPLRDAADACWGWTVQLRDLAPMRIAHAQRDEALHAMNHDMRAPQSATLALLELRRMNPQSITIEALLQRVGEHARRALSIVDGFYEAARVERDPAQCGQIDLVDLVFDAVDEVWADARAANIDVSLAERPDMAPCTADRGLLLLALDRLLRNAIRFSAAGAPVRCVLIGEAGSWVIRVIDNGPGMAPSRQHGMGFGNRAAGDHDARIRTAMRHGHLGLAMVHAVVLKHGGTLTLRSDEGAGSQFDISLPAADEEPRQQASPGG